MSDVLMVANFIEQQKVNLYTLISIEQYLVDSWICSSLVLLG
jgi:hypothetical protein